MTFTDLMDRLEKAQKTLLKMKNEAARDQLVGIYEETRLAGKLEGVSLAISYLREYQKFNETN